MSHWSHCRFVSLLFSLLLLLSSKQFAKIFAMLIKVQRGDPNALESVGNGEQVVKHRCIGNLSQVEEDL